MEDVQNIGKLLPEYRASHSRRYYSIFITFLKSGLLYSSISKAQNNLLNYATLIKIFSDLMNI
jgi:hypothetical protein